MRILIPWCKISKLSADNIESPFLPSVHAYALGSVDGIYGTCSHIPAPIIFLIPPPGNAHEGLYSSQLALLITCVK
jgi:hypothetical protein